MTRLRTPIRMLVCLAATLMLAPAGSALADDTSGNLTTFTLTAGGEEVGFEKARLVTTDSGSFFASGERRIKKGPGKIHLKSHLQRAKDGSLEKYRRLLAGRKGAGIFGFARNGVLRVVGLDVKREPTEHKGVFDKQIWDSQVWHPLAAWTSRLRGKQEPVRLAFFDIEKGTTGEATLSRAEDVEVGGKDKVITLASWSLSGTPGPSLQLYVDDHGRLMGIKGPKQSMLKKGWSWDPSTVGGDDSEDDTAAPEDDEKELAP